VEARAGLGRRGPPAAADLSLAGGLAGPQTVVSADGGAETGLDRELADRGLERRVGLVVPGFAPAIDTLARSDFLALLPSRFVQLRRDIVACEPPRSEERRVGKECRARSSTYGEARTGGKTRC